MSTGPEHYLAAEHLVAGKPVSAEDIEDGIGPESGLWPATEMELRAAQVHATLALAAATALDIVLRPAQLHAPRPQATKDWERVLNGQG